MNGDIRWEEVEVTTEHYRGGHASAAARSGFSIHAGGSSRGGAPFDPRAADRDGRTAPRPSVPCALQAALRRIGEANNRHRKPMAMGRMVERLMALGRRPRRPKLYVVGHRG